MLFMLISGSHLSIDHLLVPLVHSLSYLFHIDFLRFRITRILLSFHSFRRCLFDLLVCLLDELHH